MNGARVPNWVWMVLVLVHGVAFGWALYSGNWNFPDSDRYRQAGENLVRHGQLYARAWPDEVPKGQAVQEFTIRPLGYPLVLAVGREVAAGPWLVLLVQNLSSLFGIGMVLTWWAQRGRPRPRDWCMALMLILTFPAQIIYANGIMSEAFLQSILLGLIAAVAAFDNTGKLRYWLAAAVMVTLALLFKPVCCLLAVAMAVAGVLLGSRNRRPALSFVGLLPLLLLGAYMCWNQARTGYFHYSSIAEINLLHYNAAGVVRQVAGPAAEEEWVASVVRAANRQNSFAARQRLIQSKAEAMLLAHPWVYARQHAQGMVAFFLDPGRFDISEFLGLAPGAGGGLLAQVRTGGLWGALARLPLGLLAVLLLVLLANITRLLLAIRGFKHLGRGTKAEQTLRWVAVGMLAYLALLTGPLGAARFLMPAWPLLLGLALWGLRGPEAALAKQAETAASA